MTTFIGSAAVSRRPDPRRFIDNRQEARMPNIGPLELAIVAMIAAVPPAAAPRA